MSKSRTLKPALVILPLVASVLLSACAPAAAPSPTPTKAPAAAPTAAATKPPAPPATTAAGALSPAGQKAAAAVPAPYKGMKSPFQAGNKTAEDAGEAIYKQRCVACHGEKGDGKGPAGGALKPAPSDYTTSEQLEHFEKIQDHHFWSISEGVAGSAMPAFKGQLSEEQRWQVFMYEWKLGAKR